MDNDILIKLLMAAIAVNLYFVKRLFARIDKIESVAYNNKSKIETVELANSKNHEHLVDKISQLFDSMKELINDVKILNNKVK